MPERSSGWDNALQQAAVTDIGMRRANNQDSHAVVLATDMANWQGRGHIFMVADGMGAHAAGELASKIAATKSPIFIASTRNSLLPMPC